MTTHLAAFATAAHATAPIWLAILTVACVAGWVADRWARSIDQRADERDGRALVERRRAARATGISERRASLEEGRRLASEREDLIAQGIDPAALLVPLAPLTETGLCDGCQRLRLIVDTCPHSFSLCDECQEEPRCRECREPEWNTRWRLT